MTPMGVSEFERFFREAASLNIDKDDLRRYNDFVNRKIYDLLVIGQAKAKANGRDVIEDWDLPVTKGLQETIHDFRRMDEAAQLRPILEQIVTLPELPPPGLNMTYSEELERRLPGIAGGLSLALARAFKILDPNVENPQTKQWERAFRIFDLLL
jgi:Domain of unknown function (DUF1931)